MNAFVDQVLSCNLFMIQNYALLLVTSVAMAFWAAQRVITSVATPVAIALTVAIIALAALSRVDIMSQNVSKQDKIYAAVFGCLGAICIAIILTWLEPQKTFYWGDEPIIGGHAENFMRSFIGFENEIFGVKVASVAHVALKAVMCLLAAALTALMFSPTLRFARAYSLPSSAPEGLAQFISSSPFKSVMLRLHLIMPCVAALLWVRPLSFGLDEHLLAGLQAGTACLAGVIILVNQSTILQRYLDTTVVMWYTLKEASKGGKLDASTLMLTAAKAEAVQRLLCKVAVQVTSLGLIFLACGLGLLALTTRPRDAAVAESLLGFVVWYSGTLWLVYNVVFMWLIRTGSLRS